MITIAKRFTFDAAHHLPAMPEGHKCRRPHGHTYEVEIVLRGHCDKTGILLDYGDIATAWAPIHDAIDHRNLNDIAGLEMPSTENLVAWIFVRFADSSRRGEPQYTQTAERFWDLLERVRVHESSSTYCEMTKVEWLAFCGPHA